MDVLFVFCHLMKLLCVEPNSGGRVAASNPIRPATASGLCICRRREALYTFARRDRVQRPCVGWVHVEQCGEKKRRALVTLMPSGSSRAARGRRRHVISDTKLRAGRH